LEVVLLISLLAFLTPFHCGHYILRLSFLVEVALALIWSRVSVAFFIVVFAAGEVIVLLFFLISPCEHQVSQCDH
jgi:hypothetical protein